MLTYTGKIIKEGVVIKMFSDLSGFSHFIFVDINILTVVVKIPYVQMKVKNILCFIVPVTLVPQFLRFCKVRLPDII